uniref:Uncharacterized protein n=1 Tax=Sander lucioperca TaxID=283035 RepID=A0A8D0DG45_SANLU
GKGGTDPADALLLACKRIRPETSQGSGETVPEPNEAEVENSVFKLVATVATQRTVTSHVCSHLHGFLQPKLPVSFSRLLCILWLCAYEVSTILTMNILRS